MGSLTYPPKNRKNQKHWKILPWFLWLCVYDCTSLNGGNTCKEATCYIEAWFTRLIVAQSLEHLTLPDYSLRLSEGFDRSQCVPSVGPHVPEKFCCGTHEHNTKRMLRKSQSNDKQCCENDFNGVFKTYDPSMMSCCDDGNPRISCWFLFFEVIWWSWRFGDWVRSLPEFGYAWF